jgi:DNA-binding GntR family transcriptional regulator
MEFKGVKEGVFQYLRVHIFSGDLMPGQKLNEIELASKLKISRAPLREAFRLLENEHLIVSIPRRGCYVSELSLEDCKEIFQVREMIECFAVDLLKVKGITALPKVSLFLEKTANLPMPDLSDPYEKFEYVKNLLHFHIKLVESAGNSKLNYFYQTIFSSLARYRSTYNPETGLAIKSHKDHNQIIKLIENKDYDHAKEIIKSHTEWAFNVIKKSITNKQPN